MCGLGDHLDFSIREEILEIHLTSFPNELKTVTKLVITDAINDIKSFTSFIE